MKINPVFEKYKFVYNYFETLFKTGKRFPQSIIFEGFDILPQYFFALELARISNCLKSGEYDCNCTNCKWIKENKHPSVISVTPLDFKEDNTKTVISVKQIRKAVSLINETSDYHRFFIFSDARTGNLTASKTALLEEYRKAGFNINGNEDNKNRFPYPLTKKILQDEASNALLKSTEEAPDKVTFIFLCTNKEDIISTIVSRSLVFKIPSIKNKSAINAASFFKSYPEINIEDGFNIMSMLLKKIEEGNFDSIEVLDSIEEYFINLLKSNLKNKNLLNLINSDIKKVQTAKKYLNASILPKNVFEFLMISISKEGRNI